MGMPIRWNKESSSYRPPFPGWDRGPSACTAPPAGVLLRLYQSFRGQKRLRPHGDVYGQYLGLSAERLKDVIRPQLKAEFERKKNIGLPEKRGPTWSLGSSSLNSREKIAGLSATSWC